MKFRFIFNALVLFELFRMFSKSYCMSFKKVKMFSKALDSIIKDFYIKNNLKFDIIVADRKGLKFASEVIENLSKSSKSEPLTITFTELNDLVFKRSAIVFFGTCSFFYRNINRLNIFNLDYVRIRHFAVIEENDGDSVEIKITFNNTFISELSYNKMNHVIKLYQYFMTCGYTKRPVSGYRILNEFSKSMNWKNDLFEINHDVRDLGGCEYQVICHICVTNKNTMGSFILSTLKTVAKHLNFKAVPVRNDANVANFVFETGF